MYARSVRSVPITVRIAKNMQYPFEDHHAAEQTGQDARHHSDHGDHGIAEHVLVDDFLFREPLRARRAYVIRIQHFQRIRAGMAHQSAQRYQNDRHHRQYEMPQDVQHALYPHDLLVGRDPLHREPSQILPQEFDQQRSQKEGRERNTDDRKDGDAVIERAVLAGRGLDAQRHRYEILQNERQNGNPEGDPHRLRNDGVDRRLILEGHAEVPLKDVPQPLEVPLDDTEKRIVVQPVNGLHLVDEFLRDDALIQLRFVLLVDVVGRQTADQQINAERDQEQNENGIQNSLDDILIRHLNSFSPPLNRGGVRFFRMKLSNSG